jgi:hypothetical protein
MSATMIGVAPLAIGAAPSRPSGHYRVLAPEQGNGAVLYVRIEFGSLHSSRLVEVRETGSGERFFADLDGVPVSGIVSWREATAAEVESFRLEQRVSGWADHAQLRGAPAFAATLSVLSRKDRDDALCFTADTLRERGKDGLASAVLAYRWESDQ